VFRSLALCLNAWAMKAKWPLLLVLASLSMAACGGNSAIGPKDGAAGRGGSGSAAGRAGSDAGGATAGEGVGGADAGDATPAAADATTTDATTNDAAQPDAADAKRSDAAAADVVGVDGGMVTPGAGSRLVLGGHIELVGSGPDTCTNQVPATSDRWCAFAREVPGTAATVELWVVDVTKVAANVPVTCDTTDPSCLRLSQALYSDPTNGFRGTAFDGDTLTYSELPSMGQAGFVGTVSAWRPGWSAGRPLTSSSGVVCNGSRASRAAVCLERVITTAAGDTTAELHAGLLDTQSGGSLPFVDTIFVSAQGDNTGVQKWKASLTPDGAHVAWSTRATASGTENLAVETIGDDTSRVAVASDVSQWIVTADASKWLWLGAYNYSQGGAPSGTLQSAVFPSGMGAKTLAASVGDFIEAGPKGVLFRSAVTNNAGKLMLALDRDAPSAVTMLDQGVAFVFEATADGTRATYTKNIQQVSNIYLFDLWLSGAAGAAPCVLSSTASAFLPPRFLSAGDIAAWGRLNSATQAIQGVYTTTSDCATHLFATDLYSFTPVADEGYVFLDDVAPDPSVDEATLRYAKVASGALPAKGTPIQMRAGLSFATLMPSLPAVVYPVTTGGAGDGLYVNAPLPF
jgi:hypothetical protein